MGTIIAKTRQVFGNLSAPSLDEKGLLKETVKKDGSPGAPWFDAKTMVATFRRLFSELTMNINLHAERLAFDYRPAAIALASSGSAWQKWALADDWDVPAKAAGIALDVSLTGAGATFRLSSQAAPESGQYVELRGLSATVPTGRTMLLELGDPTARVLWFYSDAAASIKLVGWQVAPTTGDK